MRPKCYCPGCWRALVSSSVFQHTGPGLCPHLPSPYRWSRARPGIFWPVFFFFCHIAQMKDQQTRARIAVKPLHSECERCGIVRADSLAEWKWPLGLKKKTEKRGKKALNTPGQNQRIREGEKIKKVDMSLRTRRSMDVMNVASTLAEVCYCNPLWKMPSTVRDLTWRPVATGSI